MLSERRRAHLSLESIVRRGPEKASPIQIVATALRAAQDMPQGRGYNFQSAQSQLSIRSRLEMSSANIARKYSLSSDVIGRSYGTTFRSLFRGMEMAGTPRN